MRPNEFTRQCAARSKRSGVRCKNYAVRGRETCRMHGGKSKRGMEHPAYTHGAYSKDFKAVGELFAKLVNRPIEVRVSLHPVSLEERLDRIDKGMGERFDGVVYLPNDRKHLPLREQAHILRAAKKQINAEINALYHRMNAGEV